MVLIVPVIPVADRVVLEPCIGQFRESESPRVSTRLFLVPRLTCGKLESVSFNTHSMKNRRAVGFLNPMSDKKTEGKYRRGERDDTCDHDLSGSRKVGISVKKEKKKNYLAFFSRG